MFTQDSISSLFSNARFKGRSIGDVAVGIINQWGNRHQNKDYNDIRNHIQVARGRGEYANLCFSENNRGLWVLKAIENKINSLQVNHPVEPHKFTFILVTITPLVNDPHSNISYTPPFKASI
jgi:hypothetical protein